MAVNITISLNAKSAFGTIWALKGHLEMLDDDFGDLDFDLDSLDGAVESVTELSDALDDVSDKLDDIDLGGGGRSGGSIHDIIQKANSVSVATADGGRKTGKGGDPAIGPGKAKTIARSIEDAFGFRGGSMDSDTIDGMEIGRVQADIAEFFYDSRGISGPRRNLGGHGVPGSFRVNKDGSIGGSKGPDSVGGAMRQAAMTDVFGEGRAARMFENRGGFSPGFVKRWRGRQKVIDKVGAATENLDGIFKAAVPSIRTWYALIAALIPLLIVFVAQALGVAAAMGAVALAGAAVVGLGLVGHGEDMASSWRHAKEQLSGLKKELFEVMQPAMQAFAPIQAEVFDRLPGMMAELSQSLQGLTGFEDAILRGFKGIIDWTAAAVDGMVKYRAIIEELAFRFGGILADNVGAFFRWLLVETYRNQNALIQLGGVLKDLGLALYNLSVVGTYIVLAFRPMVNILVFMTSVMRNETLMVLLSITAAAYAFGKVSLFIFSAWKLLVGVDIAAKFAAMIAWINGATASTLALAAALSLVTIGLSALAGYAAYKGIQGKMDHEMARGVGPGGGYGNSSGSPRMGGATFNDNRNFSVNVGGEMDYATENMVVNTVDEMNKEKTEMDTPAPGDNK